MRKVLVIAYYFPPMGLSGVQRTMKFVKYLPSFGWQPTVLTVSSTGYFAKDESLLREVEMPDIRIIRTPSRDFNRLFGKKDVVTIPHETIRKIFHRLSDALFIPDNKIGWRRAALKAAASLLEKENFDVIFATSPPQTDFLIGKKLKEHFKIPLVIDYRDAWVDYPFKFYATALHKYLHVQMEKKVIQASDAITVTSRNIKELIVRRYGNFLSYNDVQIVSHGFDPEDMLAGKSGTLPATKKMRFTHSGVFYENITPRYFLEALRNVFQEHPRMRGRIEACFVGVFRNEHKKMIHQLGLDDAVNVVGYLDHAECVKYLFASDVLWMMMEDGARSPGKIYEYIGTQKKILGCVPKGAIQFLIEEAGGTCVGSTDVPSISNAIVRLFEQFEKKQLRGPRPEIVDKYNRKMLTGELAKVFAHLVE